LSLRVCFEGRRAVGVDYEHGGDVRRAMAAREVVLCGGAINSPQLLMLSGIGDADALGQLEIPVVAHLPGVGQNLQDHMEIYVQHACTQPISLYSAQKPWNKLRIGLEWIFLKRGLGATSHFEAGGFIRSRAGVEHPDLQYHFLPIAMNYDGTNPQDTHGFQAHVGPMRPTSVGRVALTSSDPRQAPSIQFNYMATEGDREEMRAAVRLTREIFAQKAFDAYRGPELAPGPAVQSDAKIDAFIRAKGESAYHPSCTCKMGTDSDPMAVVDEQTRVRGVECLRVVDASIMPSIVSGNLNAPTIMLAEKAADLIKGRPALPPEDVPVHIAADWERAQR
jgi:choline dehydrogenase